MVIKNVDESKDFETLPEEISKSQRKREAQEIRAIANRLVELPGAKLVRVPLDDQLRDEIERARKIRSRVARKRQLQYVAKLLRRDDIADVAEALEAFDDEARHMNARHHRAEAWRDHLLAGGDPAVGVLLETRRDANAQTIRQLLRNARSEASRNKPPAAARTLFKLLRELDETQPLPPVPTG